MNRNIIYDRVKILFFGSKASCADIISITGDRAETETINFYESITPEALKIVGIEIVSGPLVRQRLIEAIKTEHQERIAGYYFFTKSRKHVRSIVKIINEFSLGKAELYGLDPDYYFSCVPLDGKNHKVIEKYILNLKNNRSISGLFKNTIKRFLVYLNLSGKLYEGFVLTVSCSSQD